MATTLSRQRGLAKNSPFMAANPVMGASFSIGAESSDAITIAVQLTDADGKDIGVRGRVRGYLAQDASGDILSKRNPTAGVRGGTDGIVATVGDFGDAVSAKGTLVIDTVAEKFKTTTTATFKIGGLTYTKTATTALTFTAAHVITASLYGIVLVQINQAGTISTKVPLATQAYASAALALAALPEPDPGNVQLGYIAIANNTGDWTANTDDLTDGSDVTTAAFVDAPEMTGSRFFELTSESDGDVDVVIKDTGTPTFYMVLQMPGGNIVVSGAITFA